MQTASGYGGSNRRMLDEVVDVELATSGQYQQQQATSSAATFIVKQERHDDHEINELAAKIVESNKAHLAKQQQQQALQQQQLQRQQQQAQLSGGTGVIPGANGNGNILNYFGRKAPNTAAASAATNQATAGGGMSVANNMASTEATISPGSAASPSEEKKQPSDEESQMGHFGWHTCNKTSSIPYLVRAGEKYCAVRIVETKLLNKYLNYLHQDIYNCTCVRSYYITDAESRLLNEINQKHCDNQFGRDLFTLKDLVVRLDDVNKFYTFLDVCYRKLMMGNSGAHSEKCGFIRINKESVVPYTVRDNQKFVPLFYFEGETENLKLKADYLSGWDLSYLKFCCKVQGIRNELFASDQVAVISLTDIKSYFPPGIEFEDYWPSKVVDSQLLISKNGANGGNGAGGLNGGVHWTRQPTQPPQKPQTPATAAAATKTISNQTIPTHAMITAALQSQQSATTMNAVAASNLSRAKQNQGMMAAAGAANTNLVYNNNTAANSARGGASNMNVPMITATDAARNSNHLNTARMVANVWSNLAAQDQYAAYGANPMQSFNYNVMRAMQGSNGSAGNAGATAQAAPPPLVRGAVGNQAVATRNGNAQHMSSGQTGASSSSPSLSLLFPSSQSPSSLLSPPIVPSPSHKRPSFGNATADVLQQFGAAALLPQLYQQQQQNAASMASYLHSSLSMTPTSPQTSSTAGTPVPMDFSQVFGSPVSDHVAKANTGRASVVVQQSPQKVIPPPPSLIPMSAANSMFVGQQLSGHSNREVPSIHDTLQQLHNFKNLTATFVPGGRTNQSNSSRTTGGTSQGSSQKLQQQQRQQMESLANGLGHYKNNPNLATIRLAGGGAAAAAGATAGQHGGGWASGSANVAVPDYLLRAAAAVRAKDAGGVNNGRNKRSISNNTNMNTATNSSTNYLNQMLQQQQKHHPQSSDVIDLSSTTTTPTQIRSSAAAVAALQQQYMQQQAQYYQQQQQQQAQQQQQQAQQQQQQAQQQQQQAQQQQRSSSRGSTNGQEAALANCLNYLATGHAATGGGGGQQVSAGRSRSVVSSGGSAEDYSSNLMTKAAMQNPPYKMQKALIDGVHVTCINMKPYQHTDLLMRVQDLCDKFFPQSTHENCRRVLEVFNVVVYRGNSQQIKLFSTHVNQRTDCMELVQVKDVTNYMPQLRYIIKSQLQEPLQQQGSHHQAPPNKRTRIS